MSQINYQFNRLIQEKTLVLQNKTQQKTEQQKMSASFNKTSLFKDYKKSQVYQEYNGMKQDKFLYYRDSIINQKDFQKTQSRVKCQNIIQLTGDIYKEHKHNKQKLSQTQERFFNSSLQKNSSTSSMNREYVNLFMTKEKNNIKNELKNIVRENNGNNIQNDIIGYNKIVNCFQVQEPENTTRNNNSVNLKTLKGQLNTMISKLNVPQNTKTSQVQECLQIAQSHQRNQSQHNQVSKSCSGHQKSYSINNFQNRLYDSIGHKEDDNITCATEKMKRQSSNNSQNSQLSKSRKKILQMQKEQVNNVLELLSDVKSHKQRVMQGIYKLEQSRQDLKTNQNI